MTTLRDKVTVLKRRFKKVTKHRFFYNTSADLKARSNKIVCWCIVESRKHGVFIFEFPFLRKQLMSVSEWSELWTKRKRKRSKTYKSLYDILTDDVFPNISIKYHDDWKFVDLVGWTMSGIHKRSNPKVQKRN